MKKNMRVFTCALCVVLCGCSAFRHSKQTVNISCSEPDAILLVNGQRYNLPVKLDMRRDRNILIQCFKNGYYPYSRTVDSHLNRTGVLDTVGIIMLFPGIGLLTPGAWSLDETNIFIPLYAIK